VSGKKVEDWKGKEGTVKQVKGIKRGIKAGGGSPQ
jgi:hypothetical protein